MKLLNSILMMLSFILEKDFKSSLVYPEGQTSLMSAPLRLFNRHLLYAEDCLIILTLM